MSKLAITIALRFSNRRLSFGPSGRSDLSILSYGSQMRSLLMRLSLVFAMQAGVGKCVFVLRLVFLCPHVLVCGVSGLVYSDASSVVLCADHARDCYARAYAGSSTGSSDPWLGTVVCAIKAYVTWAGVDIVNECRERCGGHVRRVGMLPRQRHPLTCVL
jgi:hypothetical protein